MDNFEQKVLSMLGELQTDVKGSQTEQKATRERVESLNEKVDSMEVEQKAARVRFDELHNQVEGIHNSVALMEAEHGKQIGALMDNMVVSKELLQEVKDLRVVVDKIEFSGSVIRLVDILENKTR